MNKGKILSINPDPDFADTIDILCALCDISGGNNQPQLNQLRLRQSVIDDELEKRVLEALLQQC